MSYAGRFPTNQEIRMAALRCAVDSVPEIKAPVFNRELEMQEDFILTRAAAFENYISNGKDN